MDHKIIETIRRKSCYFLIPTTVFLLFFITRFNDNEVSIRDSLAVSGNNLKKFYGHQSRRINTIPDHPPFKQNDNNITVTYPWEDDPECSRFDVRLGQDLPRIYLISYPRSGNTWIRYLLQGATGLFTGSVYGDRKLINMGYLGEAENLSKGTTLFIKDHQFIIKPSKADKYKSKVEKYPSVLVIRNPKKCIQSFVSYRAGNRNFHYEGSDNDFKKLDKDFKGFLSHWERVATLLLKSSRYLHVVVYENLKADPLTEIRKIMRFIQMPEDPGRLACLDKHKEGYVNRGQPEFDPFNEEQTAAMAEAVARVNVLMAARGYPPLPFTAQQNTLAQNSEDDKH